jgi:hypothetical protein
VLEFAGHDDDFHSIGTAYLDQGTRKHISTVRACNKLQSGGTYRIAECSMGLIFTQLWKVSERLCMLSAIKLVRKDRLPSRTKCWHDIQYLHFVTDHLDARTIDVVRVIF